jgi:hypothetical protein
MGSTAVFRPSLSRAHHLFAASQVCSVTRPEGAVRGKNSFTRGKTDGDSKKIKRTGEIDHNVHCSTAATSSLLSLYVHLCISLCLFVFFQALFCRSWLTNEVFVIFFFANERRRREDRQRRTISSTPRGAQLAARHEASGTGCVFMYHHPTELACYFCSRHAFIFPDASRFCERKIDTLFCRYLALTAHN